MVDSISTTSSTRPTHLLISKPDRAEMRHLPKITTTITFHRMLLVKMFRLVRKVELVEITMGRAVRVEFSCFWGLDLKLNIKEIKHSNNNKIVKGQSRKNKKTKI